MFLKGEPPGMGRGNGSFRVSALMSLLRANIQLVMLGFCISILFGCGGGSGSGSGSGQADNDKSSDTDMPTLPSNRSPQGEMISEQRFVQFHAGSFDPRSAFSDPDGDELTFSTTLYRFFGTGPGFPSGLSVEGGVITGEPLVVGSYDVYTEATDPEGFTAGIYFNLRVLPNSAPAVAAANEDLVTSVGFPVDIEVTKGGMTFSEAEGDVLTYEVSMRGEPHGLFINGTRVQGAFDSVGLVELTVTASDPYGASASDIFLVAASAPEPGEPTLPDTSYVYEDEDLALPFAFRNSFYDTSPDDNHTTNAGATLGRVLFYDKRLSSTNTIACASCHQQAHGFTAPERFSIGALGVPLRRNTMSLGNVRFGIHHAWFWDMRALSLKEQVLMPIQGPEEMGSSLPMLETKLAATAFYPSLFEAAFGSPQITSERISKALAQFLQSLMSYRSRFNLAYTPMENGAPFNTSVLSAQEIRGHEIFTGVGQCALCHEHSLLINDWQSNNGLDTDDELTDLGIQIPALQRTGALGMFRAPALSNIAVTGPYMHDGRFATLREVIEHYDHGVQPGFSVDFILLHQDGTPRQLNLSEEDKAALEAFLNTFTDTEFLEDPKFSNPFQDPSPAD